MKVYRPAVPDKFEWVFPVDELDWTPLLSFDGSSLAADWTPIRMKLGYAKEGVAYRRAPLPWIGRHLLVLKREALDAVGPALEPWGELLPLECDEAEMVVFNALYSLDALDLERSEVKRFDTGRIMSIDKHVFVPDLIGDTKIFKLAVQPRGSLYLAGPLVERFERSELNGTEFQLVWSDEAR